MGSHGNICKEKKKVSSTLLSVSLLVKQKTEYWLHLNVQEVIFELVQCFCDMLHTVYFARSVDFEHGRGYLYNQFVNSGLSFTCVSAYLIIIEMGAVLLIHFLKINKNVQCSIDCKY